MNEISYQADVFHWPNVWYVTVAYRLENGVYIYRRERYTTEEQAVTRRDKINAGEYHIIPQLHNTRSGKFIVYGHLTIKKKV